MTGPFKDRTFSAGLVELFAWIATVVILAVVSVQIVDLLAR